jgi:hypothetical protein
MGFGTSPSGGSSRRDRQVWMSDDGRINFGVDDGTPVSIQSPKSYNDGEWHYVVATQGADGMRLYVDGQLVSSNTANRAESYLGYWRVGGESLAGWPHASSSNSFAGAISDVAFYTTALTSGQVHTQYRASPAS